MNIVRTLHGELLLGNRERMLSASSPTGPAFEGAQILHGMRAAPGAIERVRIDPATLAVKYKIIGKEEWIESGDLEIERLRDSTGIDEQANLPISQSFPRRTPPPKARRPPQPHPAHGGNLRLRHY